MTSKTGICDLQRLLREANPVLDPVVYHFLSLADSDEVPNPEHLLASFREDEGLSVVVETSVAKQMGYPDEPAFSRITLKVHSSLQAVGLTAAFSKALTESNISANVIAGYYHDHVFVAFADRDKAMQVLGKLEDFA